ncbi:hypothetical protein PGT21_004762 [Puccinia graminis f. sp. tritici]|uniref:Uncharacterized protein n=1 Tax=Puccinia graminis f. sp. tritici TaxID=56615 RepID=A0A5B0PN18_PUCGR|nr:hypothetical protein PGT21_004762 [Puccinia graminis f. sp. tritici]
MKGSSSAPLIEKNQKQTVQEQLPIISQIHSWIGGVETQTGYLSQDNHIGSIDHTLPEFLTEPLLDTTAKRLSVALILGKPSYSPTLEETKSIEKHISSIPQLQYGKMKNRVEVVEPLPKFEQRQILMQEDMKSLRDSLKRLIRCPKSPVNGYVNPGEYLNLFNLNRYDPVYIELDEIHRLMQKKIASLDLNENNNLISAHDSTGLHEESETICTDIIRKLVVLLCRTERFIISEVKLNPLNFRRLVCETIYYFKKHQLIAPEQLGPLLTTREASQAFSIHIIQSYIKYYGDPKYWLPLNGKNILKSWYQFSCGNIFEGINPLDNQKFLFHFNKAVLEYYQYYPREQLNTDLKHQMDKFKSSIFFESEEKYTKHSRESEEGDYVMNYDPSTMYHLVLFFKDINRFGLHHSELAHLFQVIEAFDIHILNEFEEDKDFRTKFDMMSLSTQFLSKLENIQIYLKTRFDKEHMVKSIFNQPSIAIAPMKELETLAKYLKIIESEYHQTTGDISSYSSIYAYCQHGLIKTSIEYVKSMILELADKL